MTLLDNEIEILRQKFPDGTPNVHSLSDEQKAWLHMKIQSIAEGIVPSPVISQLEKIGNRLTHATEDIPDDEMQKIVSFIFANMNEIENIPKRG
ncbi:hypothetical protein [Fibrobacter sp. UWR3]|uniref:hypothetical protein n=1 Tax=Fibrobacter sp. UWR3 TaxID=1896217 RepID=UPI000934F8B6|nr:hypothetical protein [Fibrobacter sp. UWR3]